MAPLDSDRRLLCVHAFAGNVFERHIAIVFVSMFVSTVVTVELLSGKVSEMREENAILKPTPLLAHEWGVLTLSRLSGRNIFRNRCLFFFLSCHGHWAVVENVRFRVRWWVHPASTFRGHPFKCVHCEGEAPQSHRRGQSAIPHGKAVKYRLSQARRRALDAAQRPVPTPDGKTIPAPNPDQKACRLADGTQGAAVGFTVTRARRVRSLAFDPAPARAPGTDGGAARAGSPRAGQALQGDVDPPKVCTAVHSLCFSRSIKPSFPVAHQQSDDCQEDCRCACPDSADPFCLCWAGH